jgi:mRNA interferase MazF
VITRGEIYWARLDEPAGRRSVCVLTRDEALPVLRSVTIAEVSMRVRRGLGSHVEVGTDEGLDHTSSINCDAVTTIDRSRLDPAPVGCLDEVKRAQLDRALRFALDIRY